MKLSNKNKLAYYGGSKSVKHDLKRYNSIGKEELLAASKVIKSEAYHHFLDHGRQIEMLEIFMVEKI